MARHLVGLIVLLAFAGAAAVAPPGAPAVVDEAADTNEPELAEDGEEDAASDIGDGGMEAPQAGDAASSQGPGRGMDLARLERSLSEGGAVGLTRTLKALRTLSSSTGGSGSGDGDVALHIKRDADGREMYDFRDLESGGPKETALVAPTKPAAAAAVAPVPPPHPAATQAAVIPEASSREQASAPTKQQRRDPESSLSQPSSRASALPVLEKGLTELRQNVDTLLGEAKAVGQAGDEVSNGRMQLLDRVTVLESENVQLQQELREQSRRLSALEAASAGRVAPTSHPKESPAPHGAAFLERWAERHEGLSLVGLRTFYHEKKAAAPAQSP